MTVRGVYQDVPGNTILPIMYYFHWRPLSGVTVRDVEAEQYLLYSFPFEACGGRVHYESRIQKAVSSLWHSSGRYGISGIQCNGIARCLSQLSG